MEQEVLDIFIKQINIKTTNPIIIIATCNSKEELSPLFLRLFLKSHQIGNLNKTNREKLLKWILRRDCVTLNSTLIDKIINHTSGFNYSNYMSLLLLSTK